ncbi:UvrD-helicase domain-containing protein [Pseudomonas sp. PI1]|uniref:UvrD-helicase domain-containing protein n=1 Tax=Pseudomonas sp. PI1 TaxID=1582493 RepID=UPI0009E37142|nr:UvrD-helicase domain-containing protein [Pseudomonas sp. PI1]
MDAIEIARQRATELHLDAVREGRNPWAPYEFAVAEANARGLLVEKCAPGAEILDGGRAIFDADYRLIVHEDAGTPFDQAFLVAHEIGHAELGDDEGAEGFVEIDPARSVEAAPIGLDRVVDYSPRQRREVQMDLFAREFLLPRPVVRELHIEQGMGCSEISTRLGAPFDVVAQQMLDSLLLPIASQPERDTPDAEIPLNEEQRHAAAHRGDAFLLQAGPGTGKTRTLVTRVEGLLDEGVDPRRILLLTFSNRAAAEMAERIARKRPSEAAALWIGTFHRFGLDLLRRFHELADLPSAPRLMDRTEAVELLEYEFPRLGLVHYRDLYDPAQSISDILTAISRAKDEVVDAQQYRAMAQGMLDAAPSQEAVASAERALEVAKVYEVYEGLKRQAGCLDFGDLVMRPVQMLESNETARVQLQQTYDHILVDEYQDVNRSSVRLLAALKPQGRHLWVVGDAKQSIYRFRGASSFNISRFGREDFPGGVRGYLERNYRSVPAIVETFSEFATGMATGGAHSQLKADRAPISQSDAPELRTVTSAAETSAALADSIKRMKETGFPYRDQAVLCRGNEKLSELAQELERLEIPVLFLGSLFEREEVKDLVVLLSLLVDKRKMGLLRIGCWPDFAMQLEDVLPLLEHLRESECPAEGWGEASAGISVAGVTSVGRLRQALEGFDHRSAPWTVLATVLLDRTRTVARIASSDRVTDQARGIAIWQFLNFVRAQPVGDGLPVVKLMDRIRRLLRLRDERDLRQLPSSAKGIDAVRLITIHGAKGLEFPVVHLTGCNQDSMPGAYQSAKCPPPDGMVMGAVGTPDSVGRSAHLHEQECLFYVAMSRARDRLYFYGVTRKSNGHTRPLSEYLQRLGNLRHEEDHPSLRLPTALDTLPLQVEFSGQPSFSSQAVALYDSCPRRFLYTHLMQVGGRRQSTAFMQMHDAVRDVLKDIVGAGNFSSYNWEERLEQSFLDRGLHEHGYVDDYRDIAQSMLRYFLTSRSGATVEPLQAWTLDFGSEVIVVHPDEILVRGSVRTLRKVFTGHARRSESKDVGIAAVLLAAEAAQPPSSVELVYLADEESRGMSLKQKELTDRQSKLKSMLANIRAGLFEPKRSEYTCPGCPAFFVCGATPPGLLRKEF